MSELFPGQRFMLSGGFAMETAISAGYVTTGGVHTCAIEFINRMPFIQPTFANAYAEIFSDLKPIREKIFISAKFKIITRVRH